MEIHVKITIDDKLAAMCRKVFRVKTMVFIVAVCLFAVGLFVFSAQITKPYTFESDTVISSTEVNENFDRVYTLINQHDDLIASFEEHDFSTTDDLSDIVIYEDGANSGLRTLVDITGSGRLLGGMVQGYAPSNASDSTYYKITITIDGNTFDYPNMEAYYTTGASGNSANIPLPPIKFDSQLIIQYTASSTGVHGIAFVKLD